MRNIKDRQDGMCYSLNWLDGAGLGASLFRSTQAPGPMMKIGSSSSPQSSPRRSIWAKVSSEGKPSNCPVWLMCPVDGCCDNRDQRWTFISVIFDCLPCETQRDQKGEKDMVPLSPQIHFRCILVMIQQSCLALKPALSLKLIRNPSWLCVHLIKCSLWKKVYESLCIGHTFALWDRQTAPPVGRIC